MLILKDEFQEMLRIVAVSSVEGIGFTDSIAKALNGYSLKELSDEEQRQIIQAWLYPTNDDGEIDPIDDLLEEIPTDIHYEPNHPKLEENSEIQDLTSIEFFVANVKSYHASVFGVYCSNCFEAESTIAVTTNNYTMFEFCKPCYDKLKRAMIARDAKS